MLYYLFDYLDQYDVAGAGLFKYISFRAGVAIIISLVITIVFGGRLIKLLHTMQVSDEVRNLGLAGEEKKHGTPTMGGLIILAAILIPTLLLAKIHNIYIILMLLTTLWMGTIGFIDDYIKVFKRDKGGMRARTKLIGQVGLGLIVGAIMYFHSDIVIREDITGSPNKKIENEQYRFTSTGTGGKKVVVDYRSATTNIPFVKNYQFNYGKVLWFLGKDYYKWAFLIYIPAIIFIVTAVSNAANLTDGIDGLATGTSAIAGTCLGIFAYLSGNAITASYLNIMHLPNSGELVIFSAAFIGACVGFLWYNAYPAQVFMGDTGSLTLGGIIATLAIAVRKELLLPILCGIFVAENASVLLQVSYFKYTKKKFGEGRRIFLMSPLHHHYQKKGIHEAKVVTRFWIVGIMLAVLTFITLKIR
ncbi:phospho-N-acetylmuramoyl-pentapeptide-transferase [Sphingobacteriales bacterium UPWRP_1]|nr:phospho-N-acetylmuramoyl-pentapeptide-transferase [Sphingobacteriales bacterium TSM_CSS]PSJ73154.1 phospho-N-acetylmuramoyl-pentapeptide-transferase [Sphingobacteriales bacterium UPWRP_1]